MRLVLDANVIMAMLIKPGKPIDVFFNPKLKIYAPNLLFEEFENNKKEIIEKSKLSREDFYLLYSILKNNIETVPERKFLTYREKAISICPDPKDIVYFALALYLKSGIWSNEKKLKEQDKVKVYSTHELIAML